MPLRARVSTAHRAPRERLRRRRAPISRAHLAHPSAAPRAHPATRTGPHLNALCSPSHSPLGDAAARARIDGASSSTRTAAPPPRAHLACPSRPPIRRPARAPRHTNRATFERFVLSLSLPLGDAAAAARAQQQRSSSSTPTPPAPPPPSSPLRTISHDLAAAHDLARSRTISPQCTISHNLAGCMRVRR